MLDAQMMPFMPNSISSGCHFGQPQHNEHAMKHRDLFESYAPFDRNRFHRQDRLHDEVESRSQLSGGGGTSRYQTLASTFMSSKLAMDVNNGNFTTAVVEKDLEETKSRYFEYMENREKDLDDEIDEDVDDDEFLEEEYEDAYHAQMTPDSPTRLLRFVGTVTTEIQSRFTRNKGNEDYCDVYEERFKTTLSGRELYYADLLAIASNSEVPLTSRRKLSASTTTVNCSNRGSTRDGGYNSTRNHTVIYDPSGNAKSCTLPHEGRQIQGCGLGPLEELFHSGLTWKVSANTSTCSFSSKDNGRRPISTSTFAYINKGTNEGQSSYSFPNVPMNMRKLPVSFWEEPGCRSRDQVILPSVNNTPDFTDLFDQWTDKC